MKQLLQNLGSGETQLAEVAVPRVRPGHVLIASHASLVSLGTERMLVEFGRAGWLEKARQQPEKVKQVMQKVRTEGLFPTLSSVRSKLDQPMALGYCNAGVVLEVGSGVSEFACGDRVVSNGPHAEVVCVPKHLCAKVPEVVGMSDASFVVPGAIALQGIRLLAPTLGERVVVTGLGLIGLLSVQLLRAQGCEVLGIDPDPAKCALAKEFGARTVDLSAGEDSVRAAGAFTEGRGVDGVLITASTASNGPVREAAGMCRQRGRIVLVGVAGLTIDRADFYAKELSFQVSCSYGPGRYDPDYEERGKDYPYGLVRWTEQRNFEAVLAMLARGSLNVQSLKTHRYSLEDAVQAYDAVLGSEEPQAIGVVIDYPAAGTGLEELANGDESRKIPSNRVVGLRGRRAVGKVCVAVLGAGNYASRVLLPELSRLDVRLKTLVSSQGVTGTHFGRKFRFEQASTDPAAVFADEEVDAVIVATRHDSHGQYVVEALRAGKSVFVEKPLCIWVAELEEIKNCFRNRGSDAENGGAEGGPRQDPASPGFAGQYTASPGFAGHRSDLIMMVGFNRRFSPHLVKMQEVLGRLSAPKVITYTINAGALPADHWTQDLEIGGGRIVGEACHFLDVCRALVGANITDLRVNYLGGNGGLPRDTAVLQVSFADGSVASIHYLSNGHSKVPKERLEVFCGGTILQLDNFRDLRGHGFNGFKRFKTRKVDKGHGRCLGAFIDAIKAGGEPPISPADIFEVSEWILRV